MSLPEQAERPVQVEPPEPMPTKAMKHRKNKERKKREKKTEIGAATLSHKPRNHTGTQVIIYQYVCKVYLRLKHH
jgi:hypothetical protein